MTEWETKPADSTRIVPITASKRKKTRTSSIPTGRKGNLYRLRSGPGWAAWRATWRIPTLIRAQSLEHLCWSTATFRAQESCRVPSFRTFVLLNDWLVKLGRRWWYQSTLAREGVAKDLVHWPAIIIPPTELPWNR